MYESYFRLQEAPFSISPDPRFFFLSSQHKEALAKCQYAVQQRMGLAVIYGDVGTGKTTIARRLFQGFSDMVDYKTAMIISPSLRTENALLREIMREFGVQTKRSFADSRAAFQAFLVQQFDWVTPIETSELQPGDLTFYENTYQSHERITHVGIYAGSGTVIMATTTGDYVREVPMSDPYWSAHYVGAGRPPYGGVPA